MDKSYFIETFGCQMNVRDSELIAGMLRQMGYAEANAYDAADVIVINTCCVRESAENKIYGNIGHLKHVKEKNGAVIAVCGCMTGREASAAAVMSAYKHVDIVFGAQNHRSFPRLLREHIKTGRRIAETEIDPTDEPPPVIGVRTHTYKASAVIMHGCDNFCTYCIVPYVRGREKSRDICDIISEAQILADSGAVELTLLGQNVNSYGKGLRTTFAELLRHIDTIDGFERIRFLTSYPSEFSDELIKTIAECKKVCAHVHLPLQSGSDAVLKRMNRRYTKDEYIDLAAKIRRLIPGVSLTTDIIVGFPGETEEDFSDTLDVVSRAGFSGAFTFMYSKRPGTPAADMDGQIPRDVLRERFDRLIKLLNSGILAINKARIGSVCKVLVDGSDAGRRIQTGRTDDNTLVHFTGGSPEGRFVNVKITGAKTFYLTGAADGG